VTFHDHVRACFIAIAYFPALRCRSAVAVARENGIAGNVFPLTAFEVTRTLIGCPPTAERQKLDSILATERQGTTADGNGNGITEFFYVSK